MQQNTTAESNYMEGTIVRDGLQDILQRELPHVAAVVQDWLNRGIDHLYLIGCGGSFATMIPLKWMLDSYSTLPVDVYTGWEFLNRVPRRLNERSAVILASHSGTTDEVLQALELATQHGARTLAFSMTGSPLANQCHDALTYQSPAANLSKLLLSYLVGLEILDQRDHDPEIPAIREQLLQLPDKMHTIMQRTRETGQELARRYANIEQMYVVGTGVLAGLAYQFTICNLLEMHWINAGMINAGEFQHGPLEIVDKGLPMIFLLGRGAERAIAERTLRFAQRHGAETIVFDLDDMPEIHDWFAPFALHLPLQWFNWYLGIERNHPVSTRRYMGKVPF